MQAIILAGGKGTRLSDFTHTLPKPMVPIGAKPIIINIIEHYKFFGINDIFVSTGYKNNLINQYFLNLAKSKKINKDKIIKKNNYIQIIFADFKINIIFTGKNTSTAGRIYKLKNFIKKETFMITYGDGVSNVNLTKLLKFHKKHKCHLTLTAVRPPTRFGELKLNKDLVISFEEKPQLQKGWINGGFFVAEPIIFKYLTNPQQMFEREPISKLTKIANLKAFKHKGYWQCMDNLRDYQLLKKLSKLSPAPWKNYKI